MKLNGQKRNLQIEELAQLFNWSMNHKFTPPPLLPSFTMTTRLTFLQSARYNNMSDHKEFKCQRKGAVMHQNRNELKLKYGPIKNHRIESNQPNMRSEVECWNYSQTNIPKCHLDTSQMQRSSSNSYSAMQDNFATFWMRVKRGHERVHPLLSTNILKSGLNLQPGKDLVHSLASLPALAKSHIQPGRPLLKKPELLLQQFGRTSITDSSNGRQRSTIP